MHAGWNLLLAREEDTHAATAVAVAIGALVFAPVAIADWRMSAKAVPYMTASAGLELVYLGLLATAYSLAALSFVYPIARGSAPVLVLLVSVAFLGVSVSWAAALGVLLVAARYGGREVEDCLRFAVACGAESTQHFGAGVLEQREVDRLVPDVRVEQLETPAVTVG